jgi:hypothetical protein
VTTTTLAHAWICRTDLIENAAAAIIAGLVTWPWAVRKARRKICSSGNAHAADLPVALGAVLWMVVAIAINTGLIYWDARRKTALLSSDDVWRCLGPFVAMLPLVAFFLGREARDAEDGQPPKPVGASSDPSAPAADSQDDTAV